MPASPKSDNTTQHYNRVSLKNNHPISHFRVKKNHLYYMSQLTKKILLMAAYFTAKFQSIDARFESSCDCPVHDGVDSIISV